MKNAIVIGSGIAGASVAYELAKKGLDVTIIDRNEIGQATQASAGIISPWAAQRRNKDWYELVRLGAKAYPAFMQELAEFRVQPSAYKKVGSIHLFDKQERLEAAIERVKKRRVDAPEIGKLTSLSSTDVEEVLPFVQKNTFQGLLIEGGARVDGRALQQTLLEAASTLGARNIQGDARLLIEKDCIQGVQLKDQTLFTDAVVVATGAWMDDVFNPYDITFDVRPQKAQLIHLQLPTIDTSNLPVIMPPNNQYMLPSEDRRMIIGATHETDAGFDTRVTASGMNEVLSKALTIAPGLSTSTVLEARVGLRPFCGNSLPVFGQIKQITGLYGVNGLGASGLTMGPFIGKQLAKQITGEELDIDLAPYAFDRILLQ